MTPARNVFIEWLNTQLPAGEAALVASNWNPAAIGYNDPAKPLPTLDARSLDGKGNGMDKNLLVGSDGADKLYGGKGADVLIGAKDDDRLEGGAGDDTMYGGEGDDTYVIRLSDGTQHDRIVDSDGKGSIVIYDKNGNPLNMIVLKRQGTANSWTDSDGQVTISHNSPWKITLSDGSVIELGEGFDPTGFGITLQDEPALSTGTVTGDLAKDTTNGRYVLSPTGYASAGPQAGAADVLIGTGFAETLLGLGGNDGISAGAGDDLVEGGAGNDLLLGGTGFDTLNGGAGNDFIFGSAMGLVSTPTAMNFTPPAIGQGEIEAARGFSWVAGRAAGQRWNGEMASFLGIAISGANTEPTFVANGGLYYVENTGNVIDAGTGDDYVGAGAAADIVHGGDGDDDIYGMGGADMLFGDAGSDFIRGDGSATSGMGVTTQPSEHGADIIGGGAGRDVLQGQGGNDELFGGTEDDWLWGDDSDLSDTPWSFHGNDYLDGGDGQDRLEGGGKDDELFGGAGNDTLWGDNSSTGAMPASSEGADYLDGENGNDQLAGGGGDDELIGGTGSDQLWGDSAYVVSNGSSIYTGVATQGRDYLDGGDGNDQLVSGGNDDSLFGGAGDDVLTGDDELSRLAASAHGNDYLDGEAGDDNMTGMGGNDKLLGGAGSDSIWGDDGDDQLFGGEGNDALRGGAGNDTLDGGAGTDYLLGGPGSNIFVFGAGSGYDYIEVETPASLQFNIQLTPGTAPSDFTYSRQGNDLLILRQESGDTLQISGFFVGSVPYLLRQPQCFAQDVYIRYIDGSVLNVEELAARASTPTADDDFLVSFRTDDSLYVPGLTQSSGDGNDTLFGRDGADRSDGGAGNDSLFGDLGNDTLIGGAGHDTLEGFDGDDYLDGGAGYDHLFGGTGDDTLVGGRGFRLGWVGSNFLSGDDGNDVYVFDRGFGYNWISEFGTTGSSFDTIRMGQGIAPSDLMLSRAVNDGLLISIKGTDDAIEVMRQLDPYGDNDRTIEQIIFADGTVWGAAMIKLQTLMSSPADDSLTGYDTTNDSMSGGEGNDTIDGLSGDDTLWGEAGSDLLIGGAGSDYLNGGSGDDILRGSTGVDTYAFGVGSGRDNINDSTIGDTRGALAGIVLLGQGITASDVTFLRSTESNQLLIKINSTSDRLGIDNYFNSAGFNSNIAFNIRFQDGIVWDNTAIASRLSNFTEPNPVSATGTVGADALLGGVGDDTLSGLGGNDTLGGGDGNDFLAGGAGSDVYLVGRNSGQDSIINRDNAAGDQDEIRLGTGIVATDLIFANGGTDALNIGIRDTSDKLSVFGPVGSYRIKFADGKLIDAATIVKLKSNMGERASYSGTLSDDSIVGGAESTALFGWAGNDTLGGGRGSDTLDGGLGNDTYRFNVGDGKDVISSVDTTVGKIDALRLGPSITATNLSVTLVRNITSSGDLLLSIKKTSDSVLVAGYFANDATAGNQIEQIVFDDGTVWTIADVKSRALMPSADDDLIQGYASADSLTGLDGDDQIWGLGGNDSIYGNRGQDVLIGNDGDDLIEGGAQRDSLDGGAGNDTLRGQEGDDSLLGGAGNNLLEGGDGNDQIGAGGLTSKNTLDGGAGDDYLFGGAGNDVYLFGKGDGKDEVFSNAAGVRDVLRFKSSVSPNDVRVIRTFNNLYSGSYWLDLVLSETGDRVRTSDFFDAVGALNPSQAFQQVEFSDGTVWDFQTLFAMATLWAVSGTASEDTLDGTTKSDFLKGLAGADIIQGGEGDDWLDGGTGADTMRGGLGNDTFVVNSAFDTVVEMAGEGIDTVQTGINWVLGANLENLRLTGLAAVNGIGNSAANVLTGNDSNNVLDGAGGADTMLGGLGDDTYVVDTTSDLITENVGEGVDTLQSAVTLTLGANLENLVLTGAAAAHGTGNVLDNMLTGNSGASSLYGLSGNDTLDGGAGNDSLDGGAGNDVYLFGRGDGRDILSEATADATSGKLNVLRLKSGIAPADVTVSRVGTTLEVRIAGTSDVVVVNDFFYNNDPNSSRNPLQRIEFVDGNIWSISNIVQRCAPANSAPTVASPLIDRTAFEGAALTFTLPAGSFIDPDSGDTLTYSASLSDGSALPPWLTFNAGTRTFSGTPPTAALGVTVIRVTARDGGNLGAFDDFSLSVNVENKTLAGTTGADVLTGYSGHDALAGAAGNDTLLGGAGNDTLDGGAGNDSMAGGAGHDVYFVDVTTDVITENANEGTDTVNSSVTLAQLAANVENLTLTGSNNLNGTGNGLDNILTGNSGVNSLTGGDGNDTLDGLAGNDTLIGGLGNDTFVVDSASDVVTENASAGTDTIMSSVTLTGLATNVENLVLTGTNAINGAGNTLVNRLTGNSANNALDGKAGADIMVGGLGNDSYIVDDGADAIIELAGEGIDSVTSGVTYTLAANIENLTLSGSTAINATGNALSNILTGNSGNNTLNAGDGNDTVDGGTGNDTMIGGLGDDTYFVDTTSDVVTEASGGGVDTIMASVTLTSLAGNVENLTLTGSSTLSGTGNALNNVLTGNGAVNTLNGGGGNDTLNGGAGNDTMVGGTGDDTYFVDSTSDVVTEVSGGGTDTIMAAVTLTTLANNVENLTLTGSGALNGIGNTLNNIIMGNGAVNTLNSGDGNDTLNGGAGNDTLIGGTGDDTYVVDSTGDVVTETSGAGTDTVITSVTLTTLANNVENLILTGTTALNGTGNTLNNVLTGNDAVNTLIGGTGNDTLNGAGGNDALIGGAGADSYVFGRGWGVDTVQENDTTAGVKDVVLLQGSLNQANLQFAKVGNNLEMSIIGLTDKMVFQSWYLGTQYHAEEFRFTNGSVLTDTQAQALVGAMAGFAAGGAESSFSASKSTIPELMLAPNLIG